MATKSPVVGRAASLAWLGFALMTGCGSSGNESDDSGGAGGSAALGGSAAGGSPGSGGSNSTGGSAAAGGSNPAGGSSGSMATGGSGGSTPSGGTSSGGASTGGTAGGGDEACVDAPGACPSGSTRADITTVAEMEDASRGDANADATCFFVHDGVYVQSGSTLPLYFMRGGSRDAPITWVGESRDGVVIHGRATFSAPGIALSNMTFDLTGYSQTGSFNTITVLADDITLSHLTVTGDCATGLQGGHIEIDEGSGNTLVECSLVERFGQCNGPGDPGHLDHGIYLAAGHDITIRNNVIRENSARGIQLNTESGEFGTLDTVLIEGNRIYENGHRDYEDGIVINGDGTGTIANVTIRKNFFYENYYSGIRFTGDAVSGVVVENNTFYRNGTASDGAGRSELNLDGGSPGVVASGNIFVPERTVVNECAGGVSIEDNLVLGDAAGACVSGTLAVDPMFVDPANGDFHTENVEAATYGAYAP